MEIWVNVAENDNQGNRSGFAKMIQIGSFANFESVELFGLGEKFTAAKHPTRGYRFRLGRKIYPYISVCDWAGNMCWNNYLVDWMTANELLVDLWRSKKWTVEEMDSELLDFLEKDNLVLQGDFKRIAKSYYTV